MTDNIDTKLFRDALGSFATGIAVVTARDTKNTPIGITISSFASVSLNPPLVLWSIDRNSNLFARFFKVSHYAVHILAEDMQEASNHFAKASNHQFDNIMFERGIAGLPLLPGYTARFQCEVVKRHVGGDHIILVGHVLDMQHAPAKPLVFHAGQYARLA